MNRSLMIMFMMGVIAMVMLTAFGSFFVGKVGGAENVAALKADLAGVFGGQMADAEDLSVVIRKDGDVFGVVLDYALEPRLAKREAALEYHLKRISEFVLARDSMKEQVGFVEIHLDLPDGKSFTRRYVRRAAPVVLRPE